MATSLTDLIARAKVTVETQALAKTLKAKAAKAKSSREADEFNAEAAAIQATLDWVTDSVAYRVGFWSCACGQTGSRPEGLFLHQEHTRFANSTRLIRAEHKDEWSHLPRRVISFTESVPVCGHCMCSHGFGAQP